MHLPSNINDYPENKTNNFRCHLPKPLQFHGGQWVCGLQSIIFPYSWPTLGTLDEQWIDIHFKDWTGKARSFRVPIPRGTHKTPEELSAFLSSSVLAESEKHLEQLKNRGINRKRRHLQPLIDAANAMNKKEASIPTSQPAEQQKRAVDGKEGSSAVDAIFGSKVDSDYKMSRKQLMQEKFFGKTN